MAIQYDQLRHIVLDHLRQHPEGQVNLKGDNFVRHRAGELDLLYSQSDGYLVLDMFHELYREGIVASGHSPTAIGQAMTWPFYRVTEYGQKVLSEEDYVPHDPEGYLRQIKEEIPDIDSTIIRYLEEALGCFKAGHLLAAAVMTGCAAEKAMLLLIDAFGAALTDPDQVRIGHPEALDDQPQVRGVLEATSTEPRQPAERPCR